MARNKRPKDKAPAKKRKLSVLVLFYSLLVLGLAGFAGYAYYLQKTTPEDGHISASISIPDPVEGQHEDADHVTNADEQTAVPPHKPTDKTPQKPKTEVVTEAKPHTEPKPSEPEANDPKPDDTLKEEIIPEKPVVTATEPKTDAEQTKKVEHTEKEKTVEAASTQEKEQPTPKPKEAPPVTTPEEEKPKPKPEPKVQPPKSAAPPPKPVGPLPAVPDPALAAKSDYGLLPVVSPDGRKAWRVYARPFDDPLDRPRIAIVIGDMGMSKFATRSAIQDLPGEITLSFNPYGRDLQNWVAQARAAGHETLLQLPMEPFGYPDNDPGPQSLLSRLTDKENLNRLEWMLGRFTGYSGVTNQMGSRFTTSSEDISPIIEVVRNRGLLFVDGRTSGRSVAGYIAKEKAVPVAINNRFIDNRADRVSIDQRLSELEKIARITGVAIGVGFPYPVTLERLNIWAKSLTRKGLVLAPISAIVNKQEIQ